MLEFLSYMLMLISLIYGYFYSLEIDTVVLYVFAILMINKSVIYYNKEFVFLDNKKIKIGEIKKIENMGNKVRINLDEKVIVYNCLSKKMSLEVIKKIENLI